MPARAERNGIMWEQRIRKLTRSALLVGVLALAAVAVAGSLGLDRTARRGPDKRITRQPQLVFTSGVLQRSSRGTWQLADGTLLQQAPGLEWRDQATGRPGTPAAGRRVRVTGQYFGQTLVVRQATLLPFEETTLQTISGVELSTEPPEQDMPR